MTDLERVGAVAMLLPETEQRADGAGGTFLVDGKVYAEVRDGALRVRAAGLPGAASDGEAEETWTRVALDANTDWVLVEDLVARGWEMSAPRRLLEAGGR